MSPIEVKVVVCGAGVAGVSCGIYLEQSGVKCIVLAGPMPGGQLTTTNLVDNYPGNPGITGEELSSNMVKHLAMFAEISYETVLEITKESDFFLVKTDQNIYRSKYVVVATGSSHKKLPIAEPFDNLGVSYCAICDGNFYKNQNVAVVGGGNSAFESVLYLSQICKKVYLIHRSSIFRGFDYLLKKIQKLDNVEIIIDSEISKVKGQKTLECLEITNKNGKKREITLEGLFISIGHIPQTQFVEKLVDLDSYGYILTDENQKTKITGLMACGDCCVPRNPNAKKFKQAVTAAHEGCLCALLIAEQEALNS